MALVSSTSAHRETLHNRGREGSNRRCFLKRKKFFILLGRAEGHQVIIDISEYVVKYRLGRTLQITTTFKIRAINKLSP